MLAVPFSQALGSDGGFEEAEEGDEEGCTHCFAHMLHMRWDEGKSEREGRAGAGSDVAKDFEALFVPAEVPGEDGGEDDDKETVGNVGDGGDPGLETAFEFSVTDMRMLFGRSKQILVPISNRVQGRKSEREKQGKDRPAHHDHGKTPKSHGTSQPMRIS